MKTLDEILNSSIARKGSKEAVFEGFEPSKNPEDLAEMPDNKWLAEMTRSIFQAGFNWKVVDRMWPGFEAAFESFDIPTCAMMDDEWFDTLVKNTSIVRYPQKIRSVQQNAVFIKEISAKHGGFGQMIGEWPKSDFAGLLMMLKKDGTRLGGTTGQYFLRAMGVDGYILSKDVVARLIAEGIIEKQPSSMSAMQNVQSAFNTWVDESNRSLKEISRILATSCG
ncbi:MAG: DNA-3-methyladenine glycosylase I [Pseudomonadota bacterium]